MCGLVGYVGANAVSIALGCLKKLEYRGYDSAGAAWVDGGIRSRKSVGRISALEAMLSSGATGGAAIAHTRWATHGGVTQENSHPHVSADGRIAVVHNGIIENYLELKSELRARGVSFLGETDTEVIPNLVAMGIRDGAGVMEALRSALARLKGSYGIAMVEGGDAGRVYFAKKTSPLVVGRGKGGSMVASSLVAMSGVADEFIVLSDGETGFLSADGAFVFDIEGRPLAKAWQKFDDVDFSADKGGYAHYMLKEIHDQPKVLRRIAGEYADGARGVVGFPRFPFDLAGTGDISIVACGTAYHAGLVAKYLIEGMAGVRVSVDVSSEFRYRASPMSPGGLAVMISQSGETADTIAAMNYCRERGQNVLSIVNVAHSTIARGSDAVIETLAGTEVAVASTKAFTAQVLVLYLLALDLARARGRLDDAGYGAKVRAFAGLERIFDAAFASDSLVEIRTAAGRMAAEADYLAYIGRGALYPMAMEAALKIEEVSYIPALGLASGELKHGPISLVGGRMFAIALHNSNLLGAKNASSIEEIAARRGRIILISDRAGAGGLADKAESFIPTAPAATPIEAVLAAAVPVQLMAYYASLAKGLDVDQPRNLAKSVTVE